MRTPLLFALILLAGVAGCDGKKAGPSEPSSKPASTASASGAAAEPEIAITEVCTHVVDLEAKETGKPATPDKIKACVEQGKAKLAKGPEVKCILKCGLAATTFAEAKKCKDTCAAPEAAEKALAAPSEHDFSDLEAMCKRAMEMEAKSDGKPLEAARVAACVDEGRAELKKNPEKVKCMLKCGGAAANFAALNKCKETCGADK